MHKNKSTEILKYNVYLPYLVIVEVRFDVGSGTSVVLWGGREVDAFAVGVVTTPSAVGKLVAFSFPKV